MNYKDIKIISEEEYLKGLSESDKRSYRKLSKREKEEMRFKHSLSPDMDTDTKLSLWLDFSYRPDKDTIDALNVDRIDCDERRTAFVEAFKVAHKEDNAYPLEIAEYVCRALQTNNAERLLNALCGYSVNDLAKRAGIIPDDNEDVWGYEMSPAVLIVMWSNGETTTCECEVRHRDFKICNFRRKIFQTFKNTAEIENVFVKWEPYFSCECRLFSCVDEEERRTSNDMLSYWYSMTPSDEDDDIDPDDDNEE